MKHSTFMKAAQAFAEESKCISMQVGAVIVKDDHIISHGYNGSPKGHENCCDRFNIAKRYDMYFKSSEQINHGFIVENCSTYKLTPEGREEHHKYSTENEIHAELNAILFAAKHGLSIDGSTMYVTVSPCQQCAKCLTQSGIKRIIYDKLYDKNPDNWKDIFNGSGVIVQHISEVEQ